MCLWYLHQTLVTVKFIITFLIGQFGFLFYIPLSHLLLPCIHISQTLWALSPLAVLQQCHGFDRDFVNNAVSLPIMYLLIFRQIKNFRLLASRRKSVSVWWLLMVQAFFRVMFSQSDRTNEEQANTSMGNNGVLSWMVMYSSRSHWLYSVLLKL